MSYRHPGTRFPMPGNRSPDAWEQDSQALGTGVSMSGRIRYVQRLMKDNAYAIHGWMPDLLFHIGRERTEPSDTKRQDRRVVCPAELTFPTLSVHLFRLFGNSLLYQPFQFFGQFRIILDHCLGGITSLGKFRTVVAEPAPTLLNDTVLNAQVDNLTDL